MGVIGTESPTQNFVFAVAKRLATLLLPLGYGLGEFLQTAKAAFVAAATDDIRAHGDRVSTSRIAVTTGLSRQEVARIRSKKDVGPRTKTTQRTSRVMEGWFTDPEFADSSGAAKVLRTRGNLSFAKLVKKWGGDVPPRAVLRELLAGGLAVQDTIGNVVPIRRDIEPANRSKLDLGALAIEIDVLISNACSRQSMQSPTLRRVSVSFDGRIPKAVRRNVAVRTERFLSAMSEYLQGVADDSPHGPLRMEKIESLHIVVAQHGSDDEPAFDRRGIVTSRSDGAK